VSGNKKVIVMLESRLVGTKHLGRGGRKTLISHPQDSSVVGTPSRMTVFDNLVSLSFFEAMNIVLCLTIKNDINGEGERCSVN
jgi:hypothetical protein